MNEIWGYIHKKKELKNAEEREFRLRKLILKLVNKEELNEEDNELIKEIKEI